MGASEGWANIICWVRVAGRQGNMSSRGVGIGGEEGLGCIRKADMEVAKVEMWQMVYTGLDVGIIFLLL